MVDVARLGLEIRSDQVIRANRELDRFGRTTRRAADDTRRMASASDRAERSMRTLTGTVRSFVGLLGVGLGVQQFVRMSDSFTAMSSRMTLATESAKDYAAAQSDLIRISNQFGQSLEANAALFSRMMMMQEGANATQDEMLGITEAISAAFRVMGTNQQEAASATLQFSQAMGSGVLRGEEFNAVFEASPLIMQAIADGMGVAIGSLREMAAEGRLTAETVKDALLSQRADLVAMAGEIDATIGGAIDKVQNNMLVLIGAFNETTSTASTLAGGISGLADGMAILSENTEVLDAAITAALVVAAARAAPVVVGLTASLGRQAAASLGAAAAAREQARASAAQTSALAASLRATIAAGQGNTAYAATLRANVAALAQQTAALQATAASMTLAGRAASALRGTMALLGGPAGVVLIGAFALYELVKALDDQRSAADLAKASQDLLNDALRETGPAARAAKAASLEAQQAMLDMAKDSLAAAQGQLATAESAATLGARLGLSQQEVDGYRQRVDEATEAHERIAGNISRLERELGRLPGSISNTTRAFVPMNRELDHSAELMKAARDAAEKYADRLKEAKDMLAAGLIDQGEYNARIEAARAGLESVEGAARVYAESIRETGTANRTARVSIDETARALENLTDQLIDQKARLELTEREYFKFQLAQEGIEGAAADATLALWDQVQALQAQEDAARKAEAESKRLSEEIKRSQEQLAESIQTNLSDTLFDLFSDAGDGWRSMLDRMRSAFLRFVADIAAQRIMVSIGLGAPGMAMAGQPGFGPGGSMLSGLGNQLFHGTNMGPFQTATGMPIFGGSNLGLGLAGLGGGLIGSQFGGQGGIGGGLGGALGFSLASGGSAFGAGMSGLFGALGGPIGALGGSLIGGLLGSLIGGQPSNRPSIADIDLSTGQAVFSDLGGDKAPSQQTQALTQALSAQIAAFALALGEFSDVTLDRIRIDIGERDGIQVDFGQGLESFGHDIEAAVDAIFTRIAEGAEGLDESLQSLSGGELVEALEGLLVIRDLNPLIERLGFALFDLNAVGAEAGSHLAELAGDVSGLANNMGFFFANFFTAEEQLETLTGELAREFEDLGLTMPATREGFRELVESLDLTTEAGREAFVALMGLAPGFDAMIQGQQDLQQAEQDRLDKIHAEMMATAEISGDAIATTLRDAMLGRVSQDDAGTRIAEMVLGGIHNAVAHGFAQQITDLFIDTIVTPAVQAAITGGSVAEAVSQAAIDNMIANAKAAASALGVILNDPAFQEAMKEVGDVIREIIRPVIPFVPPSGTTTTVGGGGGGTSTSADPRAFLIGLEQSIGRLTQSRAVNDLSSALRELEDNLAQAAELGVESSGALRLFDAQVDSLLSSFQRGERETGTLIEQYRQQRMAMLDASGAFRAGAIGLDELLLSAERFGDASMAIAGFVEEAAGRINATFDQSIDQIRRFLMDQREEYDFLRHQAEALAQELTLATDPQRIETLAEEINRLTMAAWGVAEEGQQRQIGEDFLDFLESVKDLANERLAEVEAMIDSDAAQKMPEDIRAAIEDGLRAVAEEMRAAAAEGRQLPINIQTAIMAALRDAASGFANAADQIPDRIDVRVTLSPAETGFL